MTPTTFTNLLACRCGSSLRLDTDDLDVADLTINIWHQHHTGSEHGACDARAARDALRAHANQRSLTESGYTSPDGHVWMPPDLPQDRSEARA